MILGDWSSDVCSSDLLFTGLCAQLLLRRRLISDKGDTHDESQKK